MEEEKDFNQPGYKPKFVSEYSMGSLDFERYNQWLKFVEQWSSEINCVHIPTLDMVQHLYSGLNILYDSWRPIIAQPKIAKEIDEKFNQVRDRKRIWEKRVEEGTQPPKAFIIKIVDLLMEIKRKIMDIKQVIGLGIVVKKNMSSREKILAGMIRKPSFEGLPES